MRSRAPAPPTWDRPGPEAEPDHALGAGAPRDPGPSAWPGPVEGPGPRTRAAMRRNRRRRRGATRRAITAVVLPVAVAGAVAALSLRGGSGTGVPTVSGHAPEDPVGHAAFDARAFLTRYEDADGRVVRRDQGGDTVSEGQAYAMLLAVAVGDERRFDLAWDWEQANLQLPDNLFSYHWANGQVVGADPATDADLDTAWALALAARRFHDSAYRTDALGIASSVLANETVEVSGHPVLVAGPWARSAPYELNPSYLAPDAMTALRTASGDDRWSALATSSVAEVTSMSGPGAGTVRLPSDWVQVDPTGALTPSGEPDGSAPANYGLDAQRVPVWFASACTAGARADSARWWPALEGAKGGGADLSYSLSGLSRTTVVNPVGLVAAASAAAADGQSKAAARLLDRADAQANRFHTYYGDAWVALGRILLDTTWLSPCPPMAPH